MRYGYKVQNGQRKGRIGLMDREFDIIFVCKKTYACGRKTQPDEENSLSIFYENYNARTEAPDGHVTDKASQL